MDNRTREQIIANEDRLIEEIERLHFIIKEVREVLNNKRETLTSQLLNGDYCNYEELLYQLDEEIRKILDKEGKDNE